MPRVRLVPAHVTSWTRVCVSRLVSFAVIGAILGCASTSDSTNGIASVASVEPLVEAYQLDSGDRLRITVFRHVDLSGDFVLDGNGNLVLPLIGESRVAAGRCVTSKARSRPPSPEAAFWSILRSASRC